MIYRDLAADPVLHITADACSPGYAVPTQRTPEQSAAFAVRVQLWSSVAMEVSKVRCPRQGAMGRGSPRCFHTRLYRMILS